MKWIFRSKVRGIQDEMKFRGKVRGIQDEMKWILRCTIRGIQDEMKWILRCTVGGKSKNRAKQIYRFHTNLIKS